MNETYFGPPSTMLISIDEYTNELEAQCASSVLNGAISYKWDHLQCNLASLEGLQCNHAKPIFHSARLYLLQGEQNVLSLKEV